MRLPGRLSAAIDVLTDVETRKRPVSEALKAWGLEHRFAGAGDRAAIGNLVYDALRRRASHATIMNNDSPRSLILAVAVRDWATDPATLNGLFAADRHAPEPFTTEEAAQAVRKIPHHTPGWIVANVPEWIAPSLERAFGESWIVEGTGMTMRPSLDMRVNTLKSSRKRVMKSLVRFTPRETQFSPLGVTIPAGTRDARIPNVTTDEAYLKGWLEVQDQGSQLVSALAQAQPGEQILDFCAGAGGKTLAMAAAMMNKGQIFAHDSDRNRLAPIYDRLKRNGARNVQVRPPSPGSLDDLTGKMDRVIIDAPCSGTGTWRRRPDIKWKLTPDLLARRVSEQAALLAEGQRYLKPGGVLIYITCSILPEENDGQIAAFLSAQAGFETMRPGSIWRAAFGMDMPAGILTAKGGVALTPHRTGTDGFYCHLLVRR